MKNNIVILTDDDGNEARFELRGLVEYNGSEYAVITPENSEEALVMRSGEDENGLELFIPVGAEETMAVYNIFREQYKDYYNFADED